MPIITQQIILLKIFFSSLLFEQIFAEYSILDWPFFSFGTLNTSSHFLLTWKVSAEKCAYNLIKSFFVHDKLFFLIFKIHFLSQIFDSLCISVQVSTFISSEFLSLLNFMSVSLLIFGEFTVIISSNRLSALFFFSFWDSHYAYVVSHDGVP